MCLICVGQIHECKRQSTLQKTQLGWIVAGRTYNNGPAKFRACTLSINQQICRTLNKFWNMEHNADEVSLNPEERNCMEHFIKTTLRDAEGRFVVQMPIKEAKLQQLGKSRSTVLSRFLILECKLQRQPALKKQYLQFMNKYSIQGHMERIDDKQATRGFSRYYIPHHAVLKNNNLTTKLRVVFDASCKSSTGVSLNECFSVGPTLQQDFFSILLRFRTFPYVITAKIFGQMYRQMRIDKRQTSLQSFGEIIQVKR